MILDDQRPLVPKWAREVFSDERALKYVKGIGIHWYADEIFVVPFALDQAHEEFPDKFLLYTEACTVDRPWDVVKVMLGDWDRGERYIHNIIEDLNHWVVGWTDWNLALDLQVNLLKISLPLTISLKNIIFYVNQKEDEILKLVLF